MATILAVDDDPDCADSMAMLLQLEGYEARAAYSGAEALEQARAGTVDVVILDVQMPVIDGVETARALRADPATSHIPIAFATSVEERDVRARFDGYEAFFSKAPELSALRHGLDHLVTVAAQRRKECA